MQPPFLMSRRVPTRLSNEAGVTLLEVLAGLGVMAVGALSVFLLFPLSAVELSRAIKDDRTAAVAAQAADLSETGQTLVSQTIGFAQISMSKGSADADQAAQLRERYAQLAQESVEMEIDLVNLQYELPDAPVARFTGPLLMQIRWIEGRIAQLIQLLAMVEGTH